MRSRGLKFLVLALLGVLLIFPVGLFFSLSPPLGCAIPERGPLQPGLSTRVLESGGRSRCYQLYIPSSYNPSAPAPLVISLHGFGSTPGQQRRYARWESLAEREGFMAVYPTGSGFPLRWNTGPLTRLDGVDDLQFMRDLLAELQRLANIDASRVYLTGFSNGGHMAHYLACQMPERFAAIGVVSGIYREPTGGCQPSRPVPLMVFFGTADPYLKVLPPPPWMSNLLLDAGIQVDQLPRPDFKTFTAGWAQRNGCQPMPETLLERGPVHAVRYTGCQAGAEVILYTLEGAGHNWPGGPSTPGLGKGTIEIDASEVLWEFFARHPLP